MNEVRDEAKKALHILCNLINNDKYELASGADRKNIKYINKLGLTDKTIKLMLLELEVDDLLSIEHHERDKNKTLYIFDKEYCIIKDSGAIQIPIYIKFYITILRTQDYVVIISFHEAEHEFKYYFK